MAGISRVGVVAPSLVRRLLGLGSRRSYGSASAAQVQYDYCDYEEEWGHKDRREAKPMVDSEGWAPGRGVQWVVIGDRGAKKHVYAERLSKLLEVPHISMGTLVRQELNPRSSLYKQIASALNEGKLVPEEIIFALLSKRLEEGYCRGETGFILDGIPRTRIQAEVLDQIADIDLVVNFKSTEEKEESEKKNLGIGNFSPCHECLGKSNAGYNLNMYSQNGQQVSATTDSEGLWKEKFNPYAEQSKSLEDYYKQQRKLVDFHVTGGAPGETWQGLLAALHLQHINAVSSSQKLTA
ncbi:Adenylate kinase/UMP-CMP kinase [Parasponia andersonii]|uniref:adenylate kinase n=1 Tax=Parasponia andersonii TaxID=3476 RepID=A0A2P5CJY9_PARAD|nr:Adenylate kinase/UMP-CMP kinase [Parasponia andersonii]